MSLQYTQPSTMRALWAETTARQRQHQVATAIRLFQQTGDTRHLAAARVTFVNGTFYADGQEVAHS